MNIHADFLTQLTMEMKVNDICLPSTQRDGDQSPQERSEDNKLSHEIESMCMDIKLRNNILPEIDRSLLFPSQQVRALKKATKKRLED